MSVIPDDDLLLPDVKLVNNYVSLLEFIVTHLATDCNLTLMGSEFYNQLLAVKKEVRDLRAVYIHSLMFKNYE